jgi:molybdate transport system substrate-binding protein
MATRHLLTDLASAFSAQSPDVVVEVVSMGGVEAAKRVVAGDSFDAVVLASGAIDTLIGEGHLVAGSRVDLVRSSMAVAIRSGEPRPSIGSEDEVRQAVLAARRVGYSTGPSGDHLMALFDRWGIAATMRERLVQARPGIPVASLVANGEADLGFQQLSELMNVDGVDVVGLLPDDIQGTTIFAGGIARISTQAARVRELLAFMASAETTALKRQQGMEPC